MQTIYLDISNKGVIPTIYAKLGDVGRKFQVVLTDSGVPYVPPNGSVFSVWYSGASGEGNYTDIGDKSAFIVNGNKVTVELITQMLAVAGEGLLCLVLNGADGSQIASWNINYVVESIPGATSEQANAYYTAFSRAVQDLPYPDTSLSTPGKAADAEATGRALANKAPAGFGLGASAVGATGYRQVNHAEADSLNKTGVYWFRDDTNHFYQDGMNSGFAGLLIHFQHNNPNAAKQIFIPYYKYGVSDGDGVDAYVVVERTRRQADCTWTPIEWRNPPMFAGVEYRTTERFNGKPVYTKRVNCGAGPNKTMIEVPIPVENLDTPIFCSVYSPGARLVLPVHGWSLDTDYTDGGFTGSSIRIFSTTDASSSTFCAIIKYTKYTD